MVTAADSYQSETAVSPCAANSSSPRFHTHSTRLPVSPTAPHCLNPTAGLDSNSSVPANQNMKLEPQQTRSIPVISNQSPAQLQSMNQEFGASVSGHGSVTAPGSMPGSLPEQRIFPGIMHERARKENMVSGSTAGEERDSHVQGKAYERGESKESLVHKDVVDEDGD